MWLDGPSGRVGVQPGVFGEVLESREVTGWQVIQESRSRVRTRIVPAPGFDQEALKQTLVRALERTGAESAEVVIEQVAALEQTAAGKTPLVRGLRWDGVEP